MIRFTATPQSKVVFSTRPLRFHGFSAIKKNRIVSPGVFTQETVKDRVARNYNGASFVSDYQLALLITGGSRSTGNRLNYYSLTPSLASVDNYGHVRFEGAGLATIRVSVDRIANLNYDINLLMTATSEASTMELVNYVPGSLAAHISEDVDSRLVGKNKVSNRNIFSVQDHASATYVRNPHVWCADWDLTCLSPWNSTGGNTRAGTLISPRHIIFAAHYEIGVGAQVRFVTQDNTVITRTMVARMRHPNYISSSSPIRNDLTIGLLDSDVPPQISFARVLPTNWETKLPSLSNIFTLPALCLDQQERATVADLYHASVNAAFNFPSKPERIEMYESKIVGDSGNPALFRINGQIVLLTVWTYGGSGTGTFVTPHNATLNSMMSQLGGGYQLTEVDLSGFPSY